MDIAAYQVKQYGLPPCWELVSDVLANESNFIPLTFCTVNQSVRQLASTLRLALHKGQHGLQQIAEPVDLCVVLLGKTAKLGLHHTGIWYQGSLLHALDSGNYYEPMSVIQDQYALIEFWAPAP